MGKYFTSTEVHVATVALKDEHIASLHKELAIARAERIRAEEARDSAVNKLIEALTPKPLAIPQKVVREPKPPTPELDLSRIDPMDQGSIRDIALSEMPSGKISASLLMSKMENIKTQVLLAHAAKADRAKEVGTVQVAAIPDEVAALIDGAIAKGKEQARTQ